MDFAIHNSSVNPNVQPFFGVVDNTVHAFRLVLAAQKGLVPRIVRRPSDTERREMIISGAVFIFNVEESGIKRWTDGLLWSASRINGNFLVYKEKPEIGRGRTSHDDKLSGGGAQYAHRYHDSPNSSRNTVANRGAAVPGLNKKTITVSMDGSDYHLISYYTEEDIHSQRFNRVSSRSDIMGLNLPPHLFCFSDFRVPPRVEMGRDRRLNIVCEPEGPEPTYSLNEELLDDAANYSPSVDPAKNDVPSINSSLACDPVAYSGVPLRAESGQMQPSDSAQMASYEHPQPVHLPLATSLEGQHGHDQAGSRRLGMTQGLMLQHDSKPWSPSFPYHTTQLDSSPPTSDPHLYRFDLSESRGQTSQSTMEISDGLSSYERHPRCVQVQDTRTTGEQQLIPSSIRDEDIVQQGLNSEGYNSGPEPLTSQFPLAYHDNVDMSWSSDANSSYQAQYPHFSAHSVNHSVDQNRFTAMGDYRSYQIEGHQEY